MKQVLLVAFILISLYSIAQNQRITIQGKIVDMKGEPVSDVYIVNLITNEKDISLANGIFTIEISPSDSLVLSHISYFRKIISAYSLLQNPIITLELEDVNIQEITVSPEQKSELDLANKNIQQIEWDVRPQPGDGFTESERAKNLMSENNSVMRSEATSLSFFSFSIGDILGKWKKKREQRRASKEFKRYKKGK
ncbi:MAG TPA: hypothetical protein PK335_09535 [Draconibacterium sp.]|nr:hypothetical protein [Draconibacterium sp.]